MICQLCEAQITEGAVFCPQCGKKVEGVMPSQEEGQDVLSGEQESSSQATADASSVNVNPMSQPTNPEPVCEVAAQHTHVQLEYAQGCVGAAWEDIRATPKWVGKMFCLGILHLIPILGFVVYGYALNWSKEVPYGGRSAMPQKVVTGKNFEIGFYSFLIQLVAGFAIAVLSMVCGWVPFIGWAAIVVISFGIQMFYTLASVRMAMAAQLGEAFKFDKIANAFKTNWASLFYAACVPSIIGGFIILAILMVIVLIFVVPMVGVSFAGYSVLGTSFGSSLSSLVSANIGLLLIAIPLIMLVALVCCIIIGAVAAWSEVCTYRAVAHWVGRYANTWTQEIPFRA